MKSVLIPFAAVVVLTMTGSVLAGAPAESEAKPSVSVEPIVAPVEVKAEPAVVCAPTAQKACETTEVKVETKEAPAAELKVETKEAPAAEVKVEATPAQPAELPVVDKPTQS